MERELELFKRPLAEPLVPGGERSVDEMVDWLHSDAVSGTVVNPAVDVVESGPGEFQVRSG